ncbi:hypothetical protein [Mycobacterium sp. DL440]|uniref:hypothetical protein n=1 Tax=Mycobacterium sp. DL440 TaxID=2675523 RepID=UPI00141E3B8C|nr:hypothetical protein [Mycobacterium sp. DL440]
MAALIGSAGLAMAAQAGADPVGQAQATKYSECMRANGVADFPNPDAGGQFPYGGISVSKATWQNAVGACANLQPSGWSADAGRTAEQQDAALRFAQCVRDHGVPDFPDPSSARDPLIDTSKMRGDVSAGSIPELKPAVEACHNLFTAALPAPGTGRPG